MGGVNFVKFFVVGHVREDTVVVPSSFVGGTLVDGLKPVAFPNVFLVAVGAVDEVPVDELHQEEHVKTVAQQVANVEFKSKGVPFVVDVVLNQSCPENVQLVRLGHDLHKSVILLTGCREGH